MERPLCKYAMSLNGHAQPIHGFLIQSLRRLCCQAGASWTGLRPLMGFTNKEDVGWVNSHLRKEPGPLSPACQSSDPHEEGT
jgi:hypothetical protein